MCMEIIRYTRRKRIMNLISCCCCCLAFIIVNVDQAWGFNAIRSFGTRSNYKHMALPVVKMSHGGYGHCTISNPPRRFEQLKKMMKWKPLSNVWSVQSSSSMANEDFDYSKEKNTTKLILEAETLRSQAKAIMAQALAMEQELKESRSRARKSKVQETDKLIEQWFHGGKHQIETSNLKGFMNSNARGDRSNIPASTAIANNTTVVKRLIEQNVTAQQVLQVVERLFERQMAASGQTSWSRRDTSELNLPIQNYLNETEYERLSDMLDTLTIASGILDQLVNNRTMESISSNTRWSGRVEQAIRARLNELRRTQKLELDRELISDVSKSSKSSTASAESYVRRNLLGQLLEQSGNTNSSSIVVVDGSEEPSTLIPLWVPSAFIPFMNANTTMTLGSEQVKALNDQVLLGSRFYVTSHKSVTGAAVFRGNIRGEKAEGNNQHTAAAFADVQRRLDKIPSLRDQVQLFLLPDPEWKPNDSSQEPEAKPVILALPKGISPDESKLKNGILRKIGKGLLFPLAILTSFRYAIHGFYLNESFFNALVKQRNLSVLTSRCLPVVAGILALQVLHEVVQYLVAKWRGIQVGAPVPLPSSGLGMFGCITPLRSFPTSRAALLDFALSGPLATSLASIGCIVASVILTLRASPAVLATFPVVPAFIFKSSLLVGTIMSWLASKPLMLPRAQPIPIHPLFLVGYSGLISSALNLLPIFRLDGGRACTAAMGTRQGAVISVSLLLLLLSLALSGGSGLGVGWGILVALFQRRPEIPARDDVTEVDNVRLGAWILSFLLSAAILSPFPGAPCIL